MAFRLGDVIIDRLQFGYGATKAGVPLYVLSQLSEMSIEVTADSNDIKNTMVRQLKLMVQTHLLT